MALSSAQKKGVGFLITAVLFAIVGIFLVANKSVPMVFPIIVDAIILIVGAYGITSIIKPDTS